MVTALFLFIVEVFLMVEAIVIVSLLVILILVFYPRPSNRRRRSKDLNDRSYWEDKRGY